MNDLQTIESKKRVDAIYKMCATNPVEMPVVNRWTPGLYAREIFMPKGGLIVSKIHKTEHPFVVISGHASVWDAKNGVQQLRGGHVGITTPGTQRILFIHEDCRWITFHPTDKLSVDDVEKDIIEPYVAGESSIDDNIINQLSKGDL